MKKAIVLALAVLATSVIAPARRAARPRRPALLASFNCSKTITLPFVTPLTGGAGFLGAEQMSWAKYAVKTLAPGLGLKVKLVGGDTPIEQGPAPAQTLAQKYIGDPSVLAVLGPSTSGSAVASTQGVLRSEDRSHLAVCDADDADEERSAARSKGRLRSSATCRATTSRARRTRTS